MLIWKLPCKDSIFFQVNHLKSACWPISISVNLLFFSCLNFLLHDSFCKCTQMAHEQMLAVFFFLMRWDFRSLSVDSVCPKPSVSGSLDCALTGGCLWPRSCLPLLQINSNCLLQLFTGTMSDVFLYSCGLWTPNRRFIMQIKGRMGENWKDGCEKDDQMASRSVGGENPLSFAFPEWILMPCYRTQTLANRAAFSKTTKKGPWGTHKWESALINIAVN